MGLGIAYVVQDAKSSEKTIVKEDYLARDDIGGAKRCMACPGAREDRQLTAPTA